MVRCRSFATAAAFGGAAFFSLAAVALYAAPPPAKTRLVNFVGDSFVEKETAAGTVVSLVGNVKLTSEDTIMTTDLATYNKTTSVADSPGKIRIEDTQNSVVGDRGIAYYKPRDAKIRGNVVINVKPKDKKAAEGSLRSEFNAPATITCDNVDYNWRDRVAVATGRLTLKYKDWIVTADKAVYFGNDEKVVLSGKVHYIRQKKRDTGDSELAVAIMTEGKEELRMPKRVKGIAEVEDEEGQNNTSATSAAAAEANAAAAIPIGGRPTTPPPSETPKPSQEAPPPVSAPVPVTPPTTPPVTPPTTTPPPTANP